MTQDRKGGWYGAGKSARGAISALATAAPWRAGTQRGSVGCEAGGREEQRAMCAVFPGNCATRSRGAAPVGWRLGPAARSAGVANSRTRQCFDTLAPGSGLATQRAAVSAGVITIAAERLHNRANVG